MTRTLIAFDGVVDCHPLDRRTLRLSGAVAGTAPGNQDTQIFFDGLPPREAWAPMLRAQVALHEVRVLELAAGTPSVEVASANAAGPPSKHCFRLDSREGTFELTATSMQLHRQPTAAFYAALPKQCVPRATRLGWRLLLVVLRLPGAASLLGSPKRTRSQ